jgi:hypothetical protein
MYDRDGKRFALGRPSMAYAHIVTQHGDPGDSKDPGGLALQYWFFGHERRPDGRPGGGWSAASCEL